MFWLHVSPMVVLGFQLCYQPLRKTDSQGKQSTLDHCD